MRKILYRGKLAEKQTQNTLYPHNRAKFFPDGWAYGFYVPERSTTPFGDVKTIASIIKTGDPKELTTGMWFDVDSDTVGEFTGLTDKNGKDIFEGDIVKLQSGGGLLCFNECEFVGIVKHRIGGDTRCTLCQLYIEAIDDPHNEANFDPRSIEVVGNIYDNPEMLPLKPKPDAEV